MYIDDHEIMCLLTLIFFFAIIFSHLFKLYFKKST